MLRKGWVLLFLAFMLAAGCQPVLPESASAPAASEPAAVEPVATEPAAAEPVAAEPVVTGPLRILFLGDPFIMENWGYDAHFVAMAAAADPPIEIETQHVIFAAEATDVLQLSLKEWSLQGLWETGEALEMIQAGPWDWVVFHQDLVFQAYTLATTPEAFADVEQAYLEYVTKFAEEVERAGAKMALVVTWHHKTEMYITMDDIVRINEAAAAETGATVIPVGLAWQRAKEADPELDLYKINDEEYPNIEGTYLTAATLYAAILGRSPVGVSYVPTDILPDTGPAAFFRDAWEKGDEDTAFLQQIAWETVQEY